MIKDDTDVSNASVITPVTAFAQTAPPRALAEIWPTSSFPLICSTGVIGVPIPMDILLAGLDPLAEALGSEGGAAAARAILTTDLVD